MASAPRILYGAVLITVLTALVLACLRLIRPHGMDVLLRPLSFAVGAAAGGAGVVRRRGARWPEPVFAALVAGVLLIFVLQVAFPGFGPGSPGVYPGATRDYVQAVLLHVVLASAGVFALPLFDPAVRRRGPAPAVGKIALAAAALVALFFVAEFARTARWGGLGYAFFGLGVLVAGGISAVILAGCGLLFTLVGALDIGAWAGGAGLFVAAVTVVSWALTGMRWFP